MDINWNLILGEAMTQLLKIFIPIFIALILHWIGDFYIKLQSSHPDLSEAIRIAAQIGFSAAEEYFKDEPKSGENKLDYAIDRANQYLNELGFSVDLHVITDAIINYGYTSNQFSWIWERHQLKFDIPDENPEPEKEIKEDDDE